MSNLRSVLNDLATQFAEGVLAAVRNASLEDLQAEAGGRARGGGGQPDPLRGGGKGGRLARRTAEDIQHTLDRVLAAVKATKGAGLRSEEIKALLKLDKRELPRVLKEGIKRKKLKAKGNKRATVYSAR